MGDEMDKIEAIDKILKCSKGNVGMSGKAKLFLLEEEDLSAFNIDELFEMFYQSTGYVRFKIMNMILERISMHELDLEQLDWFVSAEELGYYSKVHDYFGEFCFDKRIEDIKKILIDRSYQEYKSKTIEEYHPIFLEKISASNPKCPKSNLLKSTLVWLHSAKFIDELEKIDKEYDNSKTGKEKDALFSKAMNLKEIIIQDSIEEESLANFLFNREDKFVIEEAQKINIRC